MRLLFIACLVSLCDGRALPVKLPAGLSRRWSKVGRSGSLRRLSKSTTVQGGLLFGMADTIAQTLQSDPFELRRMASFSAFGAFYVGTVGAAWYRWIDRVVPKRNYGLATKVIATWLVFGGIGNYINMMYQRLSETRDFKASVEYTRAHVKDVIINDLRLWPAFDTLLFTVVPAHLRPTTLILMSLSWNTYTSVAAHQH